MPAPIGGAGGQWAISQAIPGLAGMTANATGIINNALTGLPSPSESRLENAYFGSRSGLGIAPGGVPGDDFLTNRGYDLYKRKAREQQRGGIQDLATMIGTYSGNVVPTPGQEIGQRESAADRGQRASEFSQSLSFQQQQYNDQKALLKQLTG